MRVVVILREQLELFDCLSATKTALPNLQQVWFIYTKLAVNMAAQAILGAFLAALGNMIMPVRPSRFTLL